MSMTIREIAKMIDHSLLHPTMTDEMLREGCELAKEYDVASVCIKPYAVKMAEELLQETEVKVCAVTGFPHGNSTIKIKVAEAEEVCRNGATEIDMVINIAKALGNDRDYIRDEISAVNHAATGNGAILKVIFENDYLDDRTIIMLCEICSDIGVAFIKTSSGYGFVKQENGMYSYDGATERHLRLMRKHSCPEIAIKAAGGVRTLADLMFVRSIGVTRIGATATAAILDEARQRTNKGENLEELVRTAPRAGGAY